MDFVIGLIIIAAVIFAGVTLNKKLAKRRAAETWSGIVEKKWASEIMDSEGDRTGRYEYKLKIKLGTGKSKTIAVQPAMYQTVEAGDKVNKQAGSMDPAKA